MNGIKPLHTQLEESFRQKGLHTAYETLSHRYRHTQDKDLKNIREAQAYATSRLPATQAVGEQVLSILKEVYPHPLPRVLDLGAGLGGSRWLFQNIAQTLFLVEKNPHMLALGKALQHPLGTFLSGDYKSLDLPQVDLVWASYTLSELKDPALLFSKLKQMSPKVLIFIEPGTPKGFDVIRLGREVFIEWGYHALAPCGHNAPCPMPTGDWCHFSKRIIRTKGHQRTKGASLPYEDEKFSYVILSKEKGELPPRIIKRPQKGKGHVHVDLCTKDGLIRQTRTKSKHGTLEATWGDVLP